MGRPKKESTPLSLRMDSEIFDKLTKYCEKSGQSKTVAIERALTKYIQDYETMLKKLNQNGEQT